MLQDKRKPIRIRTTRTSAYFKFQACGCLDDPVDNYGSDNSLRILRLVMWNKCLCLVREINSLSKEKQICKRKQKSRLRPFKLKGNAIYAARLRNQHQNFEVILGVLGQIIFQLLLLVQQFYLFLYHGPMLYWAKHSSALYHIWRGVSWSMPSWWAGSDVGYVAQRCTLGWQAGQIIPRA